MNEKILSSIKSSKKYLDGAFQNVRFRRINWSVLEKILIEEFSCFVEGCRAVEYPYKFIVQKFDDRKNQSSIQITCIGSPKTNLTKINFNANENPNVFENGGTLVASQGANGKVLFIVTPLKNGLMDVNYKDILISPIIDPHVVNKKFINKILQKYMLIIRHSSLYGSESLSLIDMAKVHFMVMTDIRNKTGFYKALLSLRNEWAKLIFGII